MDIEMEVFKGKADVGDLSRATIVVLNDDSFPMNVQDKSDQFAMVKGFIMHNYHILKTEFWWCCAYKLGALSAVEALCLHWSKVLPYCMPA